MKINGENGKTSVPRFGRAALVAAIILISAMPSLCLAYTANTVTDLNNFYDTYIATPSGITTLNGQTVDWFTNADGSKSILFGAGNLGGKTSWAANDKSGVVKAFAEALGISPDEIVISSKDTSGAAQATSTTVFTDLVLPQVTTAAQARRREARRQEGMPRAIGGSVRYSYLDASSDNGYLAGATVGLAWDLDQVTVGLLLPYSHIDIDDVLAADRIGSVLFGQYGTDLSDSLSSRYTVYVDYLNTSIDYDGGGSNEISTHGAGVGASLTWKVAGLANTIAASVQEHRDNSEGDRTFDTMKLGIVSAMRIGATQAVGINLTWTNDFSDYDTPYKDDNLYDAGITYRSDLSDTWTLSIGLNHQFRYNDVSATEVYLGSAMMF